MRNHQIRLVPVLEFLCMYTCMNLPVCLIPLKQQMVMAGNINTAVIKILKSLCGGKVFFLCIQAIKI